MRSPWSWADPHPIGLVSSQKETQGHRHGEKTACVDRDRVMPGEPGTWVTTRSLRGDPPEPRRSNQPCPDLRPEQGVRVLPLFLSCSIQCYVAETRKHQPHREGPATWSTPGCLS